ncbi:MULTISPECIES: cysteine peptidase family C39 domain-containing protein [unclassified Acinetobacter]|uniref:cysteine peptidase family C39 domain-containing protein n=1 Tax=unclassified Acinetobacter TaxID=196816 RepID=UPI00190BE736|nr:MULTISPECIES: cysteine peptidase family C39 domain-containing protein [unclassified Acinetobacter]MBK0062278.1 peptidase C39 [Acinetobacter sp. S55]MBK0066082.1 peptidase C39 [Acinetobacter sp. S54]
MALEIPESLLNLEANCGIFALWMLFQHHGIEIDIAELVQATQHDEENGTFTIALAVALKRFGFDVSFYTDPDPYIDPNERLIYQQTETLHIPIDAALSYSDIQNAIENGQMAIVSYDTLDGVGNQSLVYSIDEQEICFFDSFDPMPVAVFEQQRNAEGICRQVILINDRDIQPIHSTKIS